MVVRVGTVAGRVSAALSGAAASLLGSAWEARRRLYAQGLLRPRRVGARVVSVGNLTVGGTGKTTLVLHLAAGARTRGVTAGVVCRNYRPGPRGLGDEVLLYRGALGVERVFAGRRKWREAARASRAGMRLVLVDDGFSHWALERDLDLVVLDANDLWGGEKLLPAGRLREPRRALQRAGVVVVSRLAGGQDPAPLLAEVRRFAPAARLAVGRHRVTGTRALDGSAATPGSRVRVVTGTGSPASVARSALESGFEVTGVSAYRDHHWFGAAEARRERQRARRDGATVLLTAKDAVRWPARAGSDAVQVLEVAWEWVSGGEAVEQLVFEAGGDP